MKTNTSLFLGLCFLLSIFLLSAKAQNGYTISGNIIGVDSGMIKMFSATGDPQDSAIINNGRFILKGTLNEPGMHGFTISPGKYVFNIYMENADLGLSIDTANARVYDTYMVILTRVKVKGSAINDAYQRFLAETQQNERIAAGVKLFTQSKNTTDTVAAYNYRKMVDSIETVLFADQKDWLRKYITDDPASPAGPFLYYQYNRVFNSERRVPAPLLDWAMGKFTGAAKQSPYYSELITIKQGLKNKEVNQSAPDFTLLQPSKVPFRLSSTKGKFVLIDFWASWCVPCRAAIPHWQQVYKKYHTKGLEMLSISDDRTWKEWTTALDKEKMPWTQVIDEKPAGKAGRVGAMFEVHFIPFYVLLDKEGKVVLASGDEDAITKKIENLL